jgi:hypothetical protein
MRSVVNGRFAALVSILLFTGTANSALLQIEPNVYRDTATNLEWLRVAETTSEALGVTDPNDINSRTDANSIVAAALASDYAVNQGFRIATSGEVTGLYAGSGGVFEFVDNGYGGLNASLPEVFSLGDPQSWNEGWPFGTSLGAYEQAGLHLGGTPGSFVYSRVTINTVTNAGDYSSYFVDGSSYLLDGAPDPEYWSYEEGFVASPNEMSVYMVRAAVVPVPPALLLFGSGLVALWRLRTRS